MRKAKFQIEVKEHALNQIRETFLYYEDCAEGLGEKFLQAWENAAFQLEFNPDGFQKKYKSFKQVVIRNFPYVIIFEIDKTSIIIYSIIHTSRNAKLRYRK